MSAGRDHYEEVILGFDTVVRSADPSQWDNPSRCEGWTARDVVNNHMIMMTDMVAGMATGKPAVAQRGKHVSEAAYVELDADVARLAAGL